MSLPPNVITDDWTVGGVKLENDTINGIFIGTNGTTMRTNDPNFGPYSLQNGLNGLYTVADNLYLLDYKILSIIQSPLTGTPTLGTFTEANGLDPTEIVANSFWRLDANLNRLQPTKPVNLSTLTLTFPNMYSAIRATSPYDLVSNVIRSATGKPSTNITGYFGTAKSGVLSVRGKTNLSTEQPLGDRTLTTGSDVGTYGYLEITNDEDPYTAPNDGYYTALKARVNTNVAINPSNITQYYYRLIHSTTGEVDAYFYMDSILTPATSGESIVGYPATAYISGVPTYASGGNLVIQLTALNTIGKFYNATGNASVGGGSVFSTVYASPTGADRNEGSNPTYTAINLPVPASKYSTNAIITCKAIDAYGNESAGYSLIPVGKQLRLDTISEAVSESTFRVLSGTGQYPVVYGGAYDSTVSLMTNEELQILAGIVQYPPAVDYTAYMPIGPNYVGIPAGSYNNMRWITFKKTSATAINNFTFRFNNATGFGSVILSNFCFYALFSGTTLWIDCNTPYSGVGNPTANGDGALIIIDSTTIDKKITLGTNYYTGDYYLRVGIPQGSAMSFSNISVI